MIAVLPATSVDCERGFSSLNRIKNAMRSCLHGEHLEALLRISTTNMDAVTLFCDHREALILKWRRWKARRDGGKGDRLSSSVVDWYLDQEVGFEVHVDAWLHRHTWRSFIPAPKISLFTRVLNTMKALRRFIRGRRDRIESRGDKINLKTDSTDKSREIRNLRSIRSRTNLEPAENQLSCGRKWNVVGNVTGNVIKMCSK